MKYKNNFKYYQVNQFIEVNGTNGNIATLNINNHLKSITYIIKDW